MPTFLHAADLHVDSPLRGLASHEGAPSEVLRAAPRQALERLVEEAIARRVAFVVLAGDVVDVDPLFDTALFVRKQLQRLHDAGIPVVAALGNHDHAGLTPGALRLPERARVFSKRSAESFEVVPGVIVHGRSYPQQHVVEDLARDYPAPREGALNVGVLHTALTGASGHAAYAGTSPTALAGKAYHYWALGHVHAYARHDVDGVPIVFPGNTQGRHARELGPKGCVLVSYEGARVTDVSRLVLDVVRWHHAEVDVADGDDAVARAHEAVANATAEARDASIRCAVRVTVRASRRAGVEARGEEGLREALRGELQAFGDAVWLEKVRLEVPSRAAESALEASTFEAWLGEVAAALAADPSARASLDDLLRTALSELRGLSPRPLAGSDGAEHPILERIRRPLDEEGAAEVFDRAIADLAQRLRRGAP